MRRIFSEMSEAGKTKTRSLLILLFLIAIPVGAQVGRTISDLTELDASGITNPANVFVGVDNQNDSPATSKKVALDEIAKSIEVGISRDTVAAMLAETGVVDGQQCMTARYSTSHTVGDGSGGEYVYDADSTATIDGGFVLPGVGGSLSFSGTTFNGTAGTGRWLLKDQTVANVMQFGAVGDGTTDDTDAIQRAVDSQEDASYGGQIFVPKGVYRFTETITFDTNAINVIGEDYYLSWFRFDPSADNDIGFDFYKSGSPYYQSKLHDFRISSASGNVRPKTLLNLSDVRDIDMQRVYLECQDDAASVCLQTWGREQLTLFKCRLIGDRPWVIKENPNTSNGFVSADHFAARDSFFQASTTSDTVTVAGVSQTGMACIEIEDGVEVTNLTLDGNAYIGGSHVLRWIATDTAPNSIGIRINGGRWEQMRTAGISSFARIVSPTINDFGQLSISNVVCSQNSSEGNTFLDLTKVRKVLVSDVSCFSNTGDAWLIADTCQEIVCTNISAYEAQAATLTNMQEVLSVNHDTAAKSIPTYTVYGYSGNSTNITNRPLRLYGLGQRNWQQTLADDVNLYLPVRFDQGTKYARIDVTAVKSYSPVAATADNTTDRLTIAGHGFAANTKVQVSATTMPTGLTKGVDYYVIGVDSDTIQLSASDGPGAAVDFTSDGVDVVVCQTPTAVESGSWVVTASPVSGGKGTCTLISGTANCSATNVDGKLVVKADGNDSPAVQNRLGVTVDISIHMTIY